MPDTLLHVAIIQQTLVWEHPLQNRINFTKLIDQIANPVDLIVLPEMFTTGFTMSPKSIAETKEGETVTWLKNLAEKKQVAIMGSVVIKVADAYYNRLLFVKPNKQIEFYDKKHLFTLANEDKVYTGGNSHVIINYKGFAIRPLICYDLRFPVWSRYTSTHPFDVLIYVANWPKQRIHAWNTLLQARAIENMSYCIGVNRVGLDANNYEYSGHSAVYDVLGEKISKIQPNTESAEIVTLSKNHIDNFRQKLKFLEDKDRFNLE